MRLLAALMQADRCRFAQIEDLLKHDASLTYRVLRSVNSAGFGLRREVHSIREALLLLGLDQVRKWTSIWALAGLNRGPSELVTMTVLRGPQLRAARPGARPRRRRRQLLPARPVLAARRAARPSDGAGDRRTAARRRDPRGAARPAQPGAPHARRRRALTKAAAAMPPPASAALGLDGDALPDAYVDALSWAHDLRVTARRPDRAVLPPPPDRPGRAFAQNFWPLHAFVRRAVP